MEDKECRWCINFNGGNCLKINEEISIDHNLVSLVEDGELTEYLRENLEDRLKPYLSKKTYEDDAEEIIQMVTDEVYSFFQDRLEVSAEVPTMSEFHCKHWR